MDEVSSDLMNFLLKIQCRNQLLTMLVIAAASAIVLDEWAQDLHDLFDDNLVKWTELVVNSETAHRLANNRLCKSK